MICRNCGESCPDEAMFCAFCGNRLEPAEDTQEPAAPEILSPKREEQPPFPREPESPEFQPVKPERKPGVWIPLVLMAGMLVLGLLGFYFLRSSPEKSEPSLECPWFSMDGEGNVTFLEAGYSGGGTVEIPETLDGKTVSGLAEGAFAGSGAVTVILPDTVRVIGDRAFAECPDLRGLFLPAGVEAIGEGAFLGCPELEAICIPGTVKSIGHGAFENCKSLEFVFYSGYYIGWETLYGEIINPFTHIICADGAHRQGSFLP